MKFFVILENYNIYKIIKEEKLKSDDVIQDGNSYKDQVETRRSISKHLKTLANRIRKLLFVKECNVDISPDKIKRGLSNYIEVTFDHPDDISKSDKNKYYRYTIRFSDHDDSHSNERIHKTSYVDIVGKKVKNLEKAGMKLFWDCLSEIQQHINDFEIEKYGEVKTNLSSNKNESIKLRIREE